jgi:hypothetical protein
VQRIQGIEHDRGGTGARERGSDLVPDVAGFPDPEHDDFSPRLDARFDQLDRPGKIVIQARAQPLKLKNLYIENPFGLFEVIHRSGIVRSGARPGKN